MARSWVVCLVVFLACEAVLQNGKVSADTPTMQPTNFNTVFDIAQDLPGFVNMITPDVVKIALAPEAAQPPVEHSAVAQTQTQTQTQTQILAATQAPIFQINTITPAVNTAARANALAATRHIQLQHDEDSLDSEIRDLAVKKIQQFAPFTQEGWQTLSRIVSALNKVPFLSQAGNSIAGNPTVVLNLLEELQGTMFLGQFYNYLGGEQEMRAHQALLQSSATTNVNAGMVKGTGLFFATNLLVFVLLMSEMHEYFNYFEYRPGQKAPKPLAAVPQLPALANPSTAAAKLPQPAADANGADKNAIHKLLEKARAVMDIAKEPISRVFGVIAENCHNIVTFGEGGEEKPYMKLAFVWTIFVMTWSAQMAMVSATMFSLADAKTALRAKFKP